MPMKRGREGYERLNDECSQWLEGGEVCRGYTESRWRTWALGLVSLLGLGLPHFILNRYPGVRAKLTLIRVPLVVAKVILIKNQEDEEVLTHVQTIPMRHFIYNFHRYVWSYQNDSFVLLSGIEGTLEELTQTSFGLSSTQRDLRLEIYGPNRIPIEATSSLKLLYREILNPFYVFELFSIILWIFDEYYHYAICVAIMSIASIVVSLIQLKKQTVMLRNMVIEADKNYCMVSNENGRFEIISSEDLVPGDVILIPSQGCLMTCDALLLTGTCIVNESVLTGESTPITKFPAVPLDEEYLPLSTHSRHTLFCGTKVVQTRFHHDQVTALVVNTGTMTAKGQLIRSILFPKPVGFDFHRDSIRFIGVMFLVSFFGCAFTLYLYILRGAGLETILLRVLDIVTIVVPPALPTATTVGIAYALNRLKNKGIYCTSPPRINVAGKVKLVCFDKTGTLTEEGLSVWGVLIPEGGTLSQPLEDVSTLPLTSPVLQVMASCHSLTRIDNNLCGDPLDLSMFNATSWELEEPVKDETNRYDMLKPVIISPKREHYGNILQKIAVTDQLNIQMRFELGIIRQFPFSSTLLRMSVITKQTGENNMTLYTKGAPEKIISLCQQSTLPDNLAATLSYYTSAGFRVIILAYKKLPKKFKWIHAQRAKREQVETDLTFLGVLIMQNKMKSQSSNVIKQLHNAKIKCLMVTGDNMLTAVSVSRECGLLSPSTPMFQVVIAQKPVDNVQIVPLNSSLGTFTETDASSALAIDGPTWGEIQEKFPSLIPMIATRGIVFARMSPRQKSQVVDTLQSLDYIVAMVGDGANDCGALKTAHIGISLSQAEASIAAPFTSSVADITCVPELINEGRCSLVTSFGLFNFMMLYSITQFSSVLLLYMRGVEMGTMEFLYIDLVVTGLLAVAMGHSGPGPKLSLRRPITGLASPANVVPLVLQMLLVMVIQSLTLHLLEFQPWYVPVKGAEEDDEVIVCWENNVIFLVSSFQYLILAAICSKGEPHRQSFFKNWFMLFSLISLSLFNSVLLLAPFHEMTNFFELEPTTLDDLPFRFVILILPVIHFTLALVIDTQVANSRWFKWVLHKIQGKKQFKNKYKTIEQHILASRIDHPALRLTHV